jgi:hypothetical protein
LSLFLGGCSYDIDKIYDHAVEHNDAGSDAGEAVPAELSSYWLGQAFSTVDDACQNCAKSNCKSVNESCRDDATCAEFTRCVAQSTDPQAQAQCRAQFVSWLGEDVTGRDIGGPYQQCLFQDKCTSQCRSSTNWECVGKFDWPTTNQSTIAFRFRFADALSNGTPLAGINVKVCRPDDLQCSSAKKTFTTDKDGVVDVQVETQLRTFQGYFELSGPDLYPTLLRLGYPLVYDGTTNINLIKNDAVELSAGIVGVKPDPSRGILQFRAFSCAGIVAPGVSFSSDKTDSQSTYWYAGEDAVPDLQATATTSIGSGGVINAPVGRHTITATYQKKQVSQTSAPVRAGYMTIVIMAPADSGG